MNEGLMGKEVYCPKCDKVFYVRMFRFVNAKTTTCLYCNKRIKNKSKEELQRGETNESRTDNKICP